MTRAERAREIERKEFEAESRAARDRALQHAEQRRDEERKRIADWVGKETKPAYFQHRDKAVKAPAKNADPKYKKGEHNRAARLFTFNGETLSLSAWSIKTGIPINTMRSRIRLGMPIEKVLTPIIRGSRAATHSVDGLSKTLAEWADDIGITYHALLARMSKGVTLAEALAMPKGRWGRGSDFEPSLGTGAGRDAQESPDLSFSDESR